MGTGAGIVESNANGPPHRRGIPAGQCASLFEITQAREQSILDLTEPGYVPGIGPCRGQVQHPCALGRYEDRDPPYRGRDKFGIGQLAPGAVDGQSFALEQSGGNFEILGKPANLVIDRKTECRVLRVVPA